MYLGDFKEDGDLFFKFTTRAFATGAPFALASGVLSVYIDEATATEKTSGESYFDLDLNFDGKTGLNNVRIDLAGDAFFATEADYSIVITTGTVDSVSVVGEVVATFSIENRSMGKPAGATLAVDIAAIKTVVDTIPTVMVGTDNAALAATALTDATWTDAKAGFVDAAISGRAPSGEYNTEMARITGNVALASGVDMTSIHGTALTETPGQLAAAFQKFFNVAAPTATALSLPDAVPDAAGGLPISDAGGLDMDNIVKNGLISNVILLSTTIASVSGQGGGSATFGLTAGSDQDDAYNILTVLLTDITTGDVHRCRCTDYATASNTIQLDNVDSDITYVNDDLVVVLAIPYFAQADIRLIKGITAVVSQPGYLDSNLKLIGEDLQSQIDLKDFVDAGYDPSTNKVQGVVLVDTTTDNSDLVTAAAIKTALEADDGYLSILMEALVNKLLIDETNGDTIIHNTAGVSQGTVSEAFTSVANTTKRERIYIAPP